MFPVAEWYGLEQSWGLAPIVGGCPYLIPGLLQGNSGGCSAIGRCAKWRTVSLICRHQAPKPASVDDPKGCFRVSNLRCPPCVHYLFTSRCKCLLILATKLPILGIILYRKGRNPRSLIGAIGTHLQRDAPRWCTHTQQFRFARTREF